MGHINRVEDAKFNVESISHYASVVAWAEDFVYALEVRPRIYRWLFKMAIGHFAWREFKGMVKTLIETGGYIPNSVGYGCAGQEYHSDKIKLWGMK